MSEFERVHAPTARCPRCRWLFGLAEASGKGLDYFDLCHYCGHVFEAAGPEEGVMCAVCLRSHPLLRAWRRARRRRGKG